MLVALAVHDTLDGIAMVDTGASDTPGLLTSLTLLAHKWPEGLTIVASSLEAGLTSAAALGLTAAIECFTFVGVGLGAGIGVRLNPYFGTGLAMVAGSFLFLIAGTLQGCRKSANPSLNVCASAAGALLVCACRLTAP